MAHTNTNTNHQVWFRAIAFVTLLPMVACIAHAPGSGGGGGGGGGSTTVTVSPLSANVSGANTQQFSATVTGPPNTSVVWYLNGVLGSSGNMTPAGMLDQTGLYTAPDTVPSPNTASVTAASAVNGTTSAPAIVTITPSQVAVAVVPPTANVVPGGTQNFTATVTGTSNTAIGWYVNNIPNGNETFGTINASSTSTGSVGVYTAPASVPQSATVTITATSQANTGVSQTASATVSAIAVNILPLGPLVPAGGTQQFGATVTGTPSQAVTWSVAPNPACSATNIGSIDANGLYTAPPWVPATTPPGPCSVSITATAAAPNNAFSASTLANVHVTVTINSSPSLMGIGSNWLYAATVTGADPNNPSGPLVNWRTFAPSGGAGTFDKTTGFYTAPSTLPPQQPITITATSQFDPSQFINTNLTVQQSDPIGTINSPTALPSCGGNATLSATATCYQATVSCPGAADITAYLKVNTPVGTPLGTVLFGVGTGGSGLYDDPNSSGYTYGYQAVQNVLTATSSTGFNTVQVSFGAPFTSTQPNGWLQGPGGVRRLACRYATLADWVYNNPGTLKLKLPGSPTTSAPMCATGNSGGSGAIAYSLYEYGRSADFTMVELTSGPPMAQMNEGCSPCTGTSTGSICPSSMNQAEMCYQSADAAVIDTAYTSYSGSNPPAGACTNALNGNPGPDASDMFTSDGILSTQVQPPVQLPNTTVNLLFGDEDSSNAVAQGMTWLESVTPLPNHQCMASPVAHDIPSFANGAMQIATDIITLCH